MKKRLITLLFLSVSFLGMQAQELQDAEDIQSQEILDSLNLIDKSEMLNIIDTCNVNIDNLKAFVVKYQDNASALLEIGSYFQYKELALYENVGNQQILKERFNTGVDKYITIRGLEQNKLYSIKSSNNCSETIIVSNFNTIVDAKQSDEVKTIVVNNEEISNLMLSLQAEGKYNDNDFFDYYVPGGYNHLDRRNGISERTRTRVYPMSSTLEQGDIQGNITYTLLNMSGQIVDKGTSIVIGKFNPNIYIQNKNELASGVYILYIATENGVKKSFKIVKQ